MQTAASCPLGLARVQLCQMHCIWRASMTHCTPERMHMQHFCSQIRLSVVMSPECCPRAWLDEHCWMSAMSAFLLFGSNTFIGHVCLSPCRIVSPVVLLVMSVCVCVIVRGYGPHHVTCNSCSFPPMALSSFYCFVPILLLFMHWFCAMQTHQLPLHR